MALIFFSRAGDFFTWTRVFVTVKYYAIEETRINF